MVFEPGIAVQNQSAVDAGWICTGVWNSPGVRQVPDASAKWYIPHLDLAGLGRPPIFELEYTTGGYGMQDLTVGTWVELGRRLGQGERELRRKFRQHMYVGAGERGRR